MPEDTLFEHVKDRYDTEFQRRDSILQRAGIATAVLLLEGTIVVSLATDYVPVDYRCWHILFYIPVCLGLVLAILAGFLISRFFIEGDYYVYVPKADKIKGYVEKLKSGGWEGSNARERLIFRLTDVYSFAATRNFEINTRRSRLVFQANRMAVCSIVFLILALPGFYFLKASFPAKAIEVEVRNPIKIRK